MEKPDHPHYGFEFSTGDGGIGLNYNAWCCENQMHPSDFTRWQQKPIDLAEYVWLDAMERLGRRPAAPMLVFLNQVTDISRLFSKSFAPIEVRGY